MSAITTHVLDTSRGRPAAGVRISLEMRVEAGWKRIARGTTDEDGRLASLLAPQKLPESGIYRLRFEVADYFRSRGMDAFYPFVDVVFELREPQEHYHVPLLLNPFGYSTYRGS